MLRSLLLPLALAWSLSAAPAISETETVLRHYVSATEALKGRLNGASMEVDIAAELPKLQKKGHFHALRKITALGRITYDAIRFEGDKTIRNQVIARYLTAETQTATEGTQDLSVTPANYKFKYKGMSELNGRMAHQFEVKPRKKRVGLYKGELWIDASTYLPVREAGRLVKTPSIFIKRVEFVRDYEIVDGVAIPSKLSSNLDTRIAGKAQLTVQYKGLTLSEPDLKAEANQ
jgi:hypothetical protein